MAGTSCSTVLLVSLGNESAYPSESVQRTDSTATSKRKKKKRTMSHIKAHRHDKASTPPKTFSAMLKGNKHAISRFHRRYGHIAPSRIRATAKSDQVLGMQHLGPMDLIKCRTCMRMNAKKAPFKGVSQHRSTIIGERFHSDLKELPTRSITGAKYAICFVDDCSRRGWVYPLKNKSDAFDAWQRFYREEVIKNGFKCKYLRSDNGGEFQALHGVTTFDSSCKEELAAFNASRNVTAEYSPPHCQSGNGCAEVFWRETFKIVRTLLWDQQREDKWWASALHFANYLRNRVLTSSDNHSAGSSNDAVQAPPEALWLNKPISVKHLRVPLTTCWSFIEKTNRDGTLGARRTEGIFIGYASDSPCYIVRCVETGRLYNRRYDDVKFDEGCRADPDSEPTNPMVENLLASWDKSAQDFIDRDSQVALKRANTVVNDGFVRITQTRSVAQLAEMFMMPAQDYLSFLHEHEGWYSKIKDTFTEVAAGSDVPMPSEETRAQAEAGDDNPVNLPSTPGGRQPTKTQAVVEISPVQANATLSQPRSRKRKTSCRRLQLDPSQGPAVTIELSKGARQGRRSERVQACLNTARIAEALSAHLQALETVDKLPQLVAAKAVKDPKSLSAAKKRADARHWVKATEKEWNGLWEKEAFTDEPFTPGMRLHRLMWVYKRKQNGTYKARLCLDGRRQDPSTYTETRSPTMRLTSWRVLLAMAVSKGWDIHADDAHMAFLNAKRPVDKPLYAYYPEGFKNAGSRGSPSVSGHKPSEGTSGHESGKTKSPGSSNKIKGHRSISSCLRLRRCLYGSKDAPLEWFKELKNHLIQEQGLLQSETDEALFFSKKKDLFIVCHVDDLCVTGKPDVVKRYRDALYKKYSMTGSRIKEYFGLDVTHSRSGRTVSVTCKTFLTQMMSKLGLLPKAWKCPMDPEHDLDVDVKEVDPVVQSRYRSLVGSIMHPSVTCRPDVSAAVTKLSMYLCRPGVKHVRAAERVLQYLHHTKSLGLKYSGIDSKGVSREPLSTFYGTCDASYNSTKDCKGITGWAYHLGNAAVSWKCSKQKLTTLSSCEAELVAVDEAVRELRYLHKVLDDFGMQTSVKPTLLAQDNMGTIALVQSRHFNARTKHLSLRYHHCGDQQRLGVVKVSYLKTTDMVADILTKPLQGDAFCKHRSVLLGDRELEWAPLAPGTAVAAGIEVLHYSEVVEAETFFENLQLYC